MKRNDYIWLIFITLFALCGCASSQDSRIPANSNVQMQEMMQKMMQDAMGGLEEVTSLSYEEALELRALLERSIEELDFYLGVGKRHEESRKDEKLAKALPEDTPQILASRDPLMPIEVIQPSGLLDKIRAHYESCIFDENNCRIYLVDTKKISQVDCSSIWSRSTPWLVPATYTLPRHGKNLEGSSGKLVCSPGYFHYFQNDGKERRVVLCNDIIVNDHLSTISQVEPDGKTIALDFSVSLLFPKEGAKSFRIKEYPMIEKIAGKDIRKFEWKGKVSIPEGKSLIIECHPTGDDLTEKERQKGLLFFVAREVAKSDKK